MNAFVIQAIEDLPVTKRLGFALDQLLQHVLHPQTRREEMRIGHYFSVRQHHVLAGGGATDSALTQANLAGNVRARERFERAHTVRKEIALRSDDCGSNVVQRPAALSDMR